MQKNSCLILALAMLAGCAAGPQSTSPATPTPAPECFTAKQGAQGSTLSDEAQVLLQCREGGPQPKPTPALDARYGNSKALLDDIAAKHLEQGVMLDGEVVHTGFGPAIRFRSSPDGSVSRGDSAALESSSNASWRCLLMASLCSSKVSFCTKARKRIGDPDPA